MIALRIERSEPPGSVRSTAHRLAAYKARASALVLSGSGEIEIREGRLIPDGDRGIAMINKGGRSAEGGRLRLDASGSMLLAVESGYGRVAGLAELVHWHAARCPGLGSATLDGIPPFHGKSCPLQSIAAVFILGDSTPTVPAGSVFFSTHFQTSGVGAPVVIGVVAKPDADAICHLAVRASVLAASAGRVTSYRPGSHALSAAGVLELHDPGGPTHIEAVWLEVTRASAP